MENLTGQECSGVGSWVRISPSNIDDFAETVVALPQGECQMCVCGESRVMGGSEFQVWTIDNQNPSSVWGIPGFRRTFFPLGTCLVNAFSTDTLAFYSWPDIGSERYILGHEDNGKGANHAINALTEMYSQNSQ